MDEELVLCLPPLLSSHIVAQLEAQQQLEAFQGTVFKGVVIEQKLSHYLAPFSALPSRIHKVIPIVRKQRAEIYHGGLHELF